MPLDDAFLEASRNAEREHLLVAKAARRKRVAALTAGAIVILSAAIVYLILQNRAQSERRRSERLASEALATVDGNPDQAARVSLQAWQTAHTQVAEEAVRQASSKINVERSLVGHHGTVNSVQVSSKDGRRRPHGVGRRNRSHVGTRSRRAENDIRRAHRSGAPHAVHARQQACGHMER